MQNTIEKILNIDIDLILGKHINLKKAGINWKANCPFHEEKTPSFVVFSKTNTYKCFGCCEGGNAISFIMKLQGLDFIEAVKYLAKEHNIALNIRPKTKEEISAEKEKEALYKVNEMAKNYFITQLFNVENKKALDYVKSRWAENTIKEFGLGFAPDGWQNLMNFAKQTGWKEDVLMKAGLISESKGKRFDYFRNRIIFPIYDKYHRTIGFTGRDFIGKKDVPKYFNSRENVIYIKGHSFYGIEKALKTIKEKNFAYLCEGNPDIIKLHQLDLTNSIASSGTALTDIQIAELKNICSSVTIIGDSDKAGILATIKNGNNLVEAGIGCNIIQLPEEKKADPDSFFTDRKQFKDYEKANMKDYLIWRAEREKDNMQINPDYKAKIIDYLCRLIIKYPDKARHNIYIDQLSTIIKPKKAILDKLKEIENEAFNLKRRERIPDNKAADFGKYGFMEENNKYMFSTGKESGLVEVSNFVMKPLFHVESTIMAKRLYEVTNEFNYKRVVEMEQKELISISAFRLKLESLGNFIWKGSEANLIRLKGFLYEKTETCQEIRQLGWQPEGFYAWGNGIYNGKFTNVDDYGIVRYNSDNYYLPAFSKIYEKDKTLFEFERKFKHNPGKISLNDYTIELIDVFGENAKIAICFYIASLFRDIIIRYTNNFPLLNLFGPKGAGKTELAVSLLQFFGPHPKGPNLTNTSKAALGDHISQTRNAIAHIQEYKNNTEPEKIEFLKGLYDSTGRTRMNMDKDKKKETTAVDCAVAICGQEMMTADIALFSRVVYLPFYKTDHTAEEKQKFNELKKLEKKGLTHITNELLNYRDYFEENYINEYNKIADEFEKLMDNEVVEDRMFRNWCMIISAYSTLSDKIKLPFTYEDIINSSAIQLRSQNKEVKKSNEVSVFWDIFQYLVSDGMIEEEVDYKIDFETVIKTDKSNYEFNEPKNILKVNHARVFQLYRRHGKLSGENILPTKTLMYYLENDPRYLGKKASVAFKMRDKITGELDKADASTGIKKRKITRAMIFDYDALSIDLINTEIQEEIIEKIPEIENAPY